MILGMILSIPWFIKQAILGPKWFPPTRRCSVCWRCADLTDLTKASMRRFAEWRDRVIDQVGKKQD
jgi:hypothetical protein